MTDSSAHFDIVRMADQVTAQILGRNLNDLSSVLERSKTLGNEQRRNGITAIGAIIQRLSSNLNKLLAVDVLPDEILLDIFKLFVAQSAAFDDCDSKSSFGEMVKLHYAAVNRLQTVCSRWNRVMVTFSPFWSVVQSDMREDQLELVLARSGDGPLTVGLSRRLPHVADQFLATLRPLASRVSHLVLESPPASTMDFRLWRELGQVLRSFSIRKMDADLFTTTEQCFGGNLCSLRLLHLSESPLPGAHALYEQLEELVIEFPRSDFTPRSLTSALQHAPRLRVLRLLHFHGSSLFARLSDVSASYQIDVSWLQTLCIESSDSLLIRKLLGLLQISSRTSLMISCTDAFSNYPAPYIKRHIHEVLRSMDESNFCLDMSKSKFELRTREVCIRLRIPLGRDSLQTWPNYFSGFSPLVDQPIIRIQLFLTLDSVPLAQQPSSHDANLLPDPQSIIGLQNDYFALV